MLWAHPHENYDRQSGEFYCSTFFRMFKTLYKFHLHHKKSSWIYSSIKALSGTVLLEICGPRTLDYFFNSANLQLFSWQRSSFTFYWQVKNQILIPPQWDRQYQNLIWSVLFTIFHFELWVLLWCKQHLTFNLSIESKNEHMHIWLQKYCFAKKKRH